MMKDMPSMDNLTQEQVEKFKDVKNMEEMLNLAADEDIEFTSEQLEFVSGGGDDYYWQATTV